MAKEKKETSKSAVLGGFLNWFNKQVVNNGFKKEEIEELINSFVAKISPVIKDSGKEVTDVISDLVENTIVCAVLDIKETQILSELSIQNAVRENFDRLQKNQEEFTNSVLLQIDKINKKYKDIFDAINSLNEEYASKAQKQSDAIFNQLEKLTTTVFDMKNTVGDIDKKISDTTEEIKKIVFNNDASYQDHLKAGWHYLCLGEFGNAIYEFRDARNCNAKGHESHFGLALALNRIQLLDIGNNNSKNSSVTNFDKVPIYYELPKDLYIENAFEKDPNFKAALAYSEKEPSIQLKYKNCSKKIKDIIKVFRRHNEDKKIFDCFICAKVSELDSDNKPIEGNKTEDCTWAEKLHERLTEEGFHPFFSEKDIKGQEKEASTKYEALILYALIHSKCMIVVCSDQRYFDNSQYMQNEYRRFVGFLQGKGKELDNIFLVRKSSNVILSYGFGVDREAHIIKGDKEHFNQDVKAIVKYVNLKLNGQTSDFSEKKYCTVCNGVFKKNYSSCPMEGCNNNRLVDWDTYESFRHEKLLAECKEQETSLQRIKAEAELSANKIIQSANEQAQKKIKEVEEFRRIAEADVEKNKSIVEKEREEYKKREQIISQQLSAVKQDKDKTEKKLKDILLLLEKERKAHLALKEEFEQKVAQPVFYPTLETYDKSEFEIESTLLKKYLGKNPVVYIPQGVTVIGEKAFNECSKLKSVVIPNGVLKIDSMAFYHCSILTDIKLPNTLESIEHYAFFQCKSLTNITIPYSVTNIALGAFQHCDSLIRVTIPGRVSNLNELAFENCASLKCISVSEDNKKYCDVDGVLFNKDKTRLLCYPAGKDLQKYAIPESVTVISGNAFNWCRSLREVTIPASVDIVSSSAFYASHSLKNITVSSNNKKYSDIDGVLFNKEKTTLICYPAGKATYLYNSYTIPSGVKEIGQNAFACCHSLVSVIISQEVNCINYGAFGCCFSLKKIKIPAKVKTIGDNVFSSCDSLSHVTIPERFKNDLDRIFGKAKNHIQFEFYDDES